jgi:hypothetical protein
MDFICYFVFYFSLGLEDQLKSAGASLEDQEDFFIVLVDQHIEQALRINSDLRDINDDFVEMRAKMNKLLKTVDFAHDKCWDDAPCMAVPKCKFSYQNLF